MSQYYQRRIASMETPGLIIKSWFFCIVYGAIAFPIFYVFAFKPPTVLVGTLVSGFFAVWGVVYVWVTFQKTLEYWKFGELQLKLMEPPVLGGELAGELHAPGLGLRPVMIDLMALEEVLGTDSKGRTTRSEKAVYRRMHRLRSRGGRIEFRVPVPDEPEIVRGEPYLWRLRIRADLPGMDLDRTFPLDMAQGTRRSEPPVHERVGTQALPDAAREALMTAAPVDVSGIAAPAIGHATQEEVRDLPAPVSAPVLIAANLLLLVGVLYWGWRIGDVVILYWVENLVIGAMHVLRILFADPDAMRSAAAPVQSTGGERMAAKTALAAFFLVHYGGFCAVHGMFLASLFPVRGPMGVPLEIWQILADRLREPGALAVIAALALSHGYSFARNYIGREEYRRVDIARMMFRPYGRIVVVHLFIIAGGLLLQGTRAPVAALLLFILLKTGIDYTMHRRERALLSPEGA
ncbi:MAG: hypothetical protein A3F77_17335 [Betaproteobacteria bacterium RIFCSPLOWO2_12_FULL_67_28]|nr:MAG: hypothetical protein A3F77_17335 [Betaproteobacteria bacterium RIFCSPLOWO2_12_FULL_67_28]